MVNPVAFIVLLVYTCSTLLLLPRGETWGSHAHSLHQIQPSIPKQAGSWLPCRGWHTQHHTSAYHTFASTSQPPLSRKHVRFKPTPSTHGLLLSLGNFWSPGMPLPSHSRSAQLSGGGPPFTAACWHTNNQSNTPTVRQHIPKKHIRKKPILPTSTIKMKGGGDVLQGHHIRGRAISCNAFIILHGQRRNW